MKSIVSGYKERWFKLKNNLFFYFKINDLGKVDEKVCNTYFI